MASIPRALFLPLVVLVLSPTTTLTAQEQAMDLAGSVWDQQGAKLSFAAGGTLTWKYENLNNPGTWKQTGNTVEFSHWSMDRGTKVVHAGRGTIRGNRIEGEWWADSPRKTKPYPLTLTLISKPAKVNAGAVVASAGAVQGEVWLVDASGNRVRVSSGTPINQNARIQTGADGRIQVKLRDDSSFTVQCNSEIIVDSFVYDPNSGAGKLAAQVTKGAFRFITGVVTRGAPGTLRGQIRNPAGFAVGIRGSDVCVRVLDNKSVIVSVVNGGGYLEEKKLALIELPGMSRGATAGDYLIYSSVGKLEKVRRLEAATLERDVNDPLGIHGWYVLGTKAAANNDFETAIKHFTHTVALDDKYAEVYQARAKAWERKGEKQKAEEDLARYQMLRDKNR